MHRLWSNAIVTDLRYVVGDSGQTLTFTCDVIEHFCEHQQDRPDQAEAGGQLFATFSCGVIRVVRATGPRSSDQRSLFRFVPNRMAERREIKRLFRSGLHYVGDWHTHPQQVPAPSRTDIANITDTFRKSRHGLAGFLLIIVGTSPAPDGLYIAVCNQGSCEELRITET